MTPRYLLVANPTAQSGNNANRIRRARWLLNRAGIRHRFLETLPEGRAVPLIAKQLIARNFDVLIYMGGDGTFAEVAKSILKSGLGEEVRVGMLPSGTANDQGASFGLGSTESELERNVQVIAQGNECRLDAGYIQGVDDNGKMVREDYFFDSAGWGISPRILKLRNEDREIIDSIPILKSIWRDKMVYAGSLVRALIASYQDDFAFGATVLLDGEEQNWEQLTDLIVKGTQIYAGAWVFDTDARPDDGRFEVVPFFGRTDWLSKAIIHLEGGPVSPKTLNQLGMRNPSRSAGRIEIRIQVNNPSIPLVAQIDGEPFPVYPLVRIVICNNALRLIVPKNHAKSPRPNTGR